MDKPAASLKQPPMIDGPRLPPASGGAPRQLVIFAHGYGSNGDDLIGLAPFLARALPDAVFVSPNAPDPIPGYPGGYQWFPISRLDPVLMQQGVRGAAGRLDAFLEAEMKRYGLPPSACALVGFSQGTMMALHVALNRSEPIGAVVGFSGMLADPAPPASRPPVLLVHGDRDEVIPVTALLAAIEGLGRNGVPALWRVSGGTPHSIAEDGLSLAGAFLKSAFAGRFAGWTPPVVKPA